MSNRFVTKITTDKSNESILTVIDAHLCWFAPKQFADAHRSSVARWPVTQNRLYKKIICAEKLVVVKVAVRSNKVL